MLIDTYTHLDSPEFTKDLDDVLLRAKQAGVERIITIGINLESSRKALQLAEGIRRPMLRLGFIRVAPVKNVRISSLSWSSW